MSKGFCILAQNNNDHDYIKMAAMAAKSIRISQSINVSITLITNDHVDKHTKGLFDHIRPIPWMDHAEGSRHKIENTWKYFWATPYDETIVVSPDMIIPSDLGYWWDTLSEKELWLPSNKRTFTGSAIETPPLYQRNNHLSCLFSNIFYFKQGDVSAEFFCMLEQVFNNWEHFYGQHLDDTRPTKNNMSLNYSIAAYLTGMGDWITEQTVTEIPTFIDIYSSTDKEWHDSLNVYMNRDDELYISNYKQHLPIHYDNVEWVNNNRVFELYDKR